MTHLMMAQVHLLKREHDQALAEAERAVFTRPSCHGAHAAKANILNYLDRPSEAIEFAKTAIRLTPCLSYLYPAVLASAYYGCGRTMKKRSLRPKKPSSVDRDNLDALLVLVGANAALGQPEAAHGTTREVLQGKP